MEYHPYLCAVKRIVATLLLFFFTLISFQQLTVLTVYVLNQDFITENFCINKDKPEMQCKGKCHMKDTLAKTTNKDESTPSLNFETQIQFPVFISEQLNNILALNWLKNSFEFKNQILESTYTGYLFRPPPIS